MDTERKKIVKKNILEFVKEFRQALRDTFPLNPPPRKKEWDEQKNQSNRVKQGVSFEIAQMVFDDPRAINIQDRHENGE